MTCGSEVALSLPEKIGRGTFATFGLSPLLAAILLAMGTAQAAAGAADVDFGAFTLSHAAATPVTSTLPHVADGNGFDTLVLLINTGTTDANYSLQFFNQSGAQVSYQLDSAQSGMTGTIHAGSQAIVRTTGSGNSTHLGWGQLTAPSSVTGMVIYQQASPTSLQEGSAPISVPSEHFFFPFDNTGASTTSIGFVNPSPTQTASVAFTVRYETGGTDNVPAFNLNPLQQIAQAVTGIWGKTAGQRGMIEVNANTPIGLVAFRFQGAAFTLFDTIAPTAGGSTLVTSTIAHAADGNNFRSTFLLTNSGTADAPYTLSIFGATGQPQTFGFGVASPLAGTVKAGSTLTIDTTGLGTVTNLGWAQLSAPPAVSGIEIFRQTNPGKSEQQATIPISQTNSSHFFLPFDNAANTTSIALANPDPAVTATVGVTFRYVDGTSNTGQLTLLPHNYQANQLASLFTATAGKAGVAEFTSSAPVAVVEVRFNPTQAFTSLRAVSPTSQQTAGTLVTQRAMAQAALGIGLQSTGMQSQLVIGLTLLLGAQTTCSALPDGGSYKSGSSPTAVTVYYDTNCTQPYIATSPSTTVTTSASGNTFVISEIATYYGLNGAAIGTVTTTQTIDASLSSTLTVYGLGVFTPSGGARTPVQLGAYCSFPSTGTTAQCGGGIAQDFPALGLALGGVTPFTLNMTAQNPTFSGGGTVFTGSTGSLLLANTSPGSLVVQGGAVYGTNTATGGASAFVLFPPAPTAWTITDSAHDQQCQIAVTSSATRTSTLTITQISTGNALATATLDQSGSGTIIYSDGSNAAITNWTVAD